MDAVMRRSGIDVIGVVPWGTHFCQFYETSQDLIDVLVPYFREGLAANEFCMWVTSEPLKVDQATAALRVAVPDLDDYIDKGQIEILDYSQWYTRSGKFSADEVLQGWVDKLNAAQKRGYQGLRLTGNTFWLEQADWDDFTRYEEKVNEVIGRYPMMAVCTYSLKKCGAMELLDVVANHQFALIKRSGRWEIIESTYHKTMEQALRESEERYSTTLASIGDAVIATDVTGNITFMNPVAEELTGWHLNEALQKPAKEIFNIINEHTRQEAEDPVTKVLEKGAIIGLANHTILVKRDGTDVPIDDSSAPIRDKNGNTVGVVLVFRDITQRKRMEAELERLASFPKLNPNPIVEVDLAGQVHFLNPTAQQLFPDLQERGCNHPWLADWEVVAQMFGENETRTYTRDVSVGDRWYQQAMYFVPGAQRIRTYGLDITKRKKAEEALRNSERLYRAIGESIDYGIWVCSPDGRNIYASESFLKLVGLTQKQCSDFGWGDVLHPDDAERTIAAWKECVRTGGTWDIEHRFRGVDGKWHPILARGVPVHDERGQIICWAGINLDISEIKQIEEALKQARDELEQRVLERTAELSSAKEDLEVANEELRVELSEHEKLEARLIKAKDAAEAAANAKASFLANMSHELRTPLNAVIGFSSLLLDDRLTPDQEDYIDGIRNGGEALLALINDILDFSRAEKEKVVLEHQLISLRHCIDESLGMVAVQAERKGLNLASTINYGTQDTIIGDPDRLRQILVNLLTNAVKFTDAGKVSVSVSSKPVIDNKRQILFEVQDTGIGISPEKMNELFQPFGQAEYNISRKRGGVGLGLAISKRLVELMGGRIWADSTSGEGSTFRFTIQTEVMPGKHLDLEDMDKVAFEKAPGHKSLKILVAEDNPSNQRVLVDMLKRMGYRPDAVADGREVLQSLERQPYDLILMDIRMPEMNGLDATKEIRRLWPAAKQPCIVAITAYAMEGDKEKCLDAGMDGYISKPVKLSELAGAISKCPQP